MAAAKNVVQLAYGVGPPDCCHCEDSGLDPGDEAISIGQYWRLLRACALAMTVLGIARAQADFR